MNHGVEFEMTVNLGNMITIVVGIVTWAVTLAVAWTKFSGHIDMLAFRVGLMEKALETITEVLKKFATQEVEMAVLKTEIAALAVATAENHKSIEQLRVGEGFIQKPRRANLDGEYKRD